MKTLRLLVLTVALLALLTFAYPVGAAAGADSMSGKWISPAADAAKKNPIAPTHDSIAAGQKIYSKTCAMCHGKTGDADGPAVIELNIHPAKLSDPKLATESDGSLFWKITTGKNRCRHLANDFPNRSLAFGQLHSDAPEAINALLAD